MPETVTVYVFAWGEDANHDLPEGVEWFWTSEERGEYIGNATLIPWPPINTAFTFQVNEDTPAAEIADKASELADRHMARVVKRFYFGQEG